MDVKNRLTELLIRLQHEEIDAFDELYSLTKKGVYISILLIIKNEHTVEDIMQETYIDFLNHKNKLKHDIDVYGYLVQSAKNKAINYWNKNKYEHEYVLSNYQDESYRLDKIIDSGLIQKIQNSLNPREYEIFMLKVLGDYSFKEISKLKKVPIGTCTWLYQEARKKLQDKLGGIY